MTSTIDDLYAVFLQAVNYICKSLPLFVFASLVSILWSDGGDSVAQLWKPTLALVFDFISTGSYIAMRHMEMVIQAGHLKMLDTDVLRSKNAETRKAAETG